MKSKKVYSQVNTIIDKETGEMIDVSIKEVSLVLDKDTFMLIYASFWNIILKSKLDIVDIELLARILRDYGDGTLFSVTKVLKDEIAKLTGRSSTSYNKSTRKLLNANFIIQKSSRVYQINPEHAFKGSSNNRKKAIIQLEQK